MPKKLQPIFFVGFGDPKDTPGAGLPSLDAEHRNIRAALYDAGALDSWLLASSLDAKRADLVQQFTHRVVIFHFGGHAGQRGIWLPAEDPGSQVVSGPLLENFLAQQNNLKLAFFNACETHDWAVKLAESIPYVVATVRKIDDAVALNFASLFYGYLAENKTIEEAFQLASAGIAVQHEQLAPLAPSRRMEVDDDICAPSDAPIFPWILCSNPYRAEKDRAWTLSVAANDPLIGLPQLVYDPATLPNRPYVTIKGHTEADAPIFFGRNAEIRALYDWAATDSISAPVLLFHGQSGSGKSSLLNAGLLPRLRKVRDVTSLRRGTNLVDDLHTAIGASTPESADAAIDAWLRAPQPRLIILDQVEEAITHASTHAEIEAFVQRVREIFSRRPPNSRARLILSFRKEFLAEIQGLFAKDFAEKDAPPIIDVEPFWLDRLDSEGIIEVIEGPALRSDLRSKYNLTYDEGFPKFVASKLQDPNSPAATILQILLNKLWDKATENGAKPHYTEGLYLGLSALDNPLAGFYGEQLDKLYATPGFDQYRNGIELDLLFQHTTELSTSCLVTLADLQANYNSVSGLAELVQRNKDLYLLSDPTSELAESGPATALTHDTLAPVIRRDHVLSLSPGARARRILENRAREWVDAKKNGTALDAADLRVVKRGLKFMRALHGPEKRLLAASRRRARRNLAIAASILVVILAIGGGAAFYQWEQTQSIQLGNSATQEVNRQSDLATLLSVAAYRFAPTFEARNAMYSVYSARPDAVTTLYMGEKNARAAAYSPDGKWLVIVTLTSVEAWDVSTYQRRFTAKVNREILDESSSDWDDRIAFSPDSSMFAISSHFGPILLWSIGPNGISQAAAIGSVDSSESGGEGFATFGADGKIVARAGGGAESFYSIAGQPIAPQPSVKGAGLAQEFLFNPSLQHIDEMAVLNSDGSVNIQDIVKGSVIQLRGPVKTMNDHLKAKRTVSGRLDVRMAFSADGNILAAGTGDGTIDVFDLRTQNQLCTIDEGQSDKERRSLTAFALNRDGSRLAAVVAEDGGVGIWDTAGGSIIKPVANNVIPGAAADEGKLNDVAFSPNLDRVAEVNSRGLALILDTSRSNRPADWYKRGDKPPTFIVSPDGAWEMVDTTDQGLVILDRNHQKSIVLAPFQRKLPGFAAFSPDSRYFAWIVRGEGGQPTASVRAVDLDTLATPSAAADLIPPAPAAVGRMALGPGGLVVATSDGKLIIWHAGREGSQRIALNESDDTFIDKLIVSADGRYVAYYGNSRKGSVLGVRDLQSPARALPVNASGGEMADYIQDIAFGPPTSQGAPPPFAIVRTNGIVVWPSVEAQKHTSTPFDSGIHDRATLRISFNQDGTLIAVSAAQFLARLYDVRTNQWIGRTLNRIQNLPQEDQPVFAASGKGFFGPATEAQQAGPWNLAPLTIDWDLDENSWTDRACRIANRNFTKAEWKQYFGWQPYRKVCPDLP